MPNGPLAQAAGRVASSYRAPGNINRDVASAISSFNTGVLERQREEQERARQAAFDALAQKQARLGMQGSIEDLRGQRQEREDREAATEALRTEYGVEGVISDPVAELERRREEQRQVEALTGGGFTEGQAGAMARGGVPASYYRERPGAEGAEFRDYERRAMGMLMGGVDRAQVVQSLVEEGLDPNTAQAVAGQAYLMLRRSVQDPSVAQQLSPNPPEQLDPFSLFGGEEETDTGEGDSLMATLADINEIQSMPGFEDASLDQIFEMLGVDPEIQARIRQAMGAEEAPPAPAVGGGEGQITPNPLMGLERVAEIIKRQFGRRSGG